MNGKTTLDLKQFSVKPGQPSRHYLLCKGTHTVLRGDTVMTGHHKVLEKPVAGGTGL